MGAEGDSAVGRLFPTSGPHSLRMSSTNTSSSNTFSAGIRKRKCWTCVGVLDFALGYEADLIHVDLSSIRGAISHLVYVSDERNLLYVTDIWGSRGPSHDLEHLSCFFPGLLALGAHSIPGEYLDPEERAAHLAIAKGIATTCYLAYADTASGLGPETINFSDKGRRWVDTEGEIRVDVPVEKDPSRRGYTVRDPRWLSRPEVRIVVTEIERILKCILLDCRKLVHSIPGNRRTNLAGKGIRDLPGHRTMVERQCGVCECGSHRL